MIAEGIRMKLALVFFAMLGFIVLGLPFSVAGDSSLTGRVQTFMTYGLSGTSVLLGMLTIFMSRSLADEFVGKQIQVVMVKPIPRWQFLLGKWLGITLLNAAFLLFAAVAIYGMVYYIKWAYPPLDDTYDAQRLQNEVLVARHATAHTPPDFTKWAEVELKQRIEQGYFDDRPSFTADDRARALRDLTAKHEASWRIVGPERARELTFNRILCSRSKDDEIQLRYKTEIIRPPWDEIFRAEWRFGDSAKGTPVYRVPIRHPIGRYHTIAVPADAVAPDHTLHVEFYNINPFEGEPQYGNVIEFRKADDPEILFVVGSFTGNYLRLLTLIMCKLMFLASVSVMMATVFSYPVACLASFTVYILAATRSFVTESLDMATSRAGTMFESLPQFAIGVVTYAYQAIFLVIPDFGRYDAVENFVDGQNVTLVWVLQGVTELTLLSGVVLGLAMLFFHRREVAEVSI